MISLARRITIGTVTLTILAVGIAAVLVWSVARWQWLQTLDDELRSHVERLRMVAAQPRPVRLFEQPQPPPERVQPPVKDPLRREMILIDADSGKVLSPFPESRPASYDLIELMKGAPEDVPVWLRARDGRHLRGIALTVTPREPITDATTEPVKRMRGFFAVDATSFESELVNLAIILGGVWGTASLLACFSAWWLRRSVLGPLRKLGALIDRIDPNRLERIDADVPTEVRQLVRLINQLLERLSAMMAREKTTIANIAHELRSPISGLRTSMEVAALQDGLPAKELIDRCFPTVVAMHGMVVNLLALSRLEAGHEPITVVETDIHGVIDEAWAMHDSLAKQRGVKLAISSDDIPMVCTSPDKMRMIIGNLLGNAASYSPEGSVIVVSLRRLPPFVEISIANQITGPVPDLKRIFEPFYRGDVARSSVEHCGLGLTLAHRLAALLAVELKVDVEKEWFRASLNLPMA